MSKDWTGNTKSTYSPMGASNHSEGDRASLDYYATDPSVINELFLREHFDGPIWECACGEGHLSKALNLVSNNLCIWSTDLINRGYGDAFFDFLSTYMDDNHIRWYGDIITNPPYKYAEQFVYRALDIIHYKKDKYPSQKVAMFLKLTFLEGQSRYNLFKKYPPRVVYVFSKRQKCGINGDFNKINSSAVAYAWFVWYKNFVGDPIIKWIN